MELDEYILGPPGTGKTTTLISRITSAIESGIDSERIGLITFTRGAAEVAVSRVQEAFPEAKFPHVRTLHSMAYGELGIKKSQVISDYKEIAESIHLPLRRSSLHPPREGDLVFQVLHLARTLDMDVTEALQRCGYQVDYRKVKMAENSLADYKEQTGKIDFVDMLKMLREECHVPPLDLLLIDEAQDLSRIQWDIVDMFKCHKVFAGDDDQTIYSWAGADVSEYIRRIEMGTKTILSKSHRLPEGIWKEANKLVRQVSLRVEKEWAPRDTPGTFVKVAPQWIPRFAKEGRYMVLALFQYQLAPIARDLRQRGLGFDYPDGRTSVPEKIVRAHKLWEDWRLHDNRSTDLAAVCRPFLNAYAIQNNLLDSHRPEYSLMSSAGPQIKDSDRVYYDRALNSLGPKIRLSTIHRAKGAEAEHVFLMNPTTKRTRELFHGTRDDLIRLLYVGMTRASESLHVTRGGELI